MNKKELDMIGDWLDGVLNEYFGDTPWTPKRIRTLVEVKFGKRMANRYTDNQLRESWIQYEPQ